jgi:predicted peptidase
VDEIVKAADLKKEDFAVTEVKEAFDWGAFKNIIATTKREVLDVYLSDEAGNKVEAEEGKTVAVEMSVSPSVGSPFYYELSTGFNRWVSKYELTVAGNGIEAFHAFNFYDNDQWISEIADKFKQATFTSTNNTPIVYGELVPGGDPNQLKALVIWLHGAGEGTNRGKNDNYIDLLGNEVTALATEAFQSLYEGGAYVVTPQAPTMWMDDGAGAYQNGDKGSCYRTALKEFIDSYVASHEDIDPNRIIIGGCSNGGYMTMEMTLYYPGYFYKAYPICEAFMDQYISDDMIAAAKEGGTAYWFTYALTDGTVNPDLCSKPTIERFKAAGIETHVTEWAKVEDLTGRFKDDEGKPYEYNGHWSWIYFDNNANTEGDLNEWEWLAAYEDDMYFKSYEDNLYWYENRMKQGIYGDDKNVKDKEFGGVERGREIYDPASDAWYWLDACYEGAVAKNKEVWMPYVFQSDYEQGINPQGKWVRYEAEGKMIKGWYACDAGVYYYDQLTGAMLKGTHEIAGKVCTFDDITGVLVAMR